MAIDWKQIEEWNKKYLVKAFTTEEEYGTTFVERTEGDYLITPDGTRLLDFYNQLYCVNIGQNVPEVQEAIKEALDRYGFVWDIYTTDYKAEVAKILIEDIFGKDSWAKQVRYALGGGDAVETAILMARLVTGKPLVATREYGYHGVGGSSVQLTRLNPSRSHASDDSLQIRTVPGSLYQNTFQCPAPFCYRCSLCHTYPECKSVRPDGMLPCVAQTEETIITHGVSQVAAIITEPAYGAGTIIPPKEYLPQIYEMKKRLGILWIVDEVLMGFGRLGEMFGYQAMGNHEIEPDMVTVAKGITSSAMPLGAVIVGKTVADFMAKIRWNHVCTFAGHPVALAAAKANLNYILKNDVVGQAKAAGEYFGNELRNLQEKHKTIGLVAGSGMFWQVELVKNRETKEPFVQEDRYTTFSGNTDHWPTHIIGPKCAEKGVLLSGFVPNTLRIGASLTVSKADMDKAINALDYALGFLK